MASPGKKKKKIPTKVKLGIVAVFALFLIWGFSGGIIRSGSVKFGICHIILEQSIPFPKTLHIASVYETPKFARILYSHTDAFGQYRYSQIQCNFEQDQDAANREWLERVFVAQQQAGVSIDQLAASARFNKKAMMEYLSKKRRKISDSGAIERIAQAVGAPTPRPIFVLDSVTIDNFEFTEERISLYQKALTTMVQNPPDLTLPPPLPKNVSDYKK